MKLLRVLIVVGLLLILVIGTLGCGPSVPPAIPVAGYWATPDYGTAETGVQFYVSPDGKNITNLDSPLGTPELPESLDVYWGGAGGIGLGINSNIPITRGSFGINALIFIIRGNFSDSTHCSGKFSFSGEPFVSFSWTATPQVAPVGSFHPNVKIIR